MFEFQYNYKCVTIAVCTDLLRVIGLETKQNLKPPFTYKDGILAVVFCWQSSKTIFINRIMRSYTGQ